MILSKLVGLSSFRMGYVLQKRMKELPRVTSVNKFHFIPPSQYDYPRKQKLNPKIMLRDHWEVWPILACGFVVIMMITVSFFAALGNKVDVVFTTHSRDNISRTMDMMNPDIHKLRIINQRYEPWPEIYVALEEMKTAERKKAIADKYDKECRAPAP